MSEKATSMILPDNWTDKDQLGLDDFRGILRDILVNGPTRITVGVFGDWGSGKTSLMRMLKADVTTAGHRAVWFDAWKYDNDSLSRALIQELFNNNMYFFPLMCYTDSYDIHRADAHSI